MITVYRHRLSTIFDKSNWTVWYEVDSRLVAPCGVETETKSFDKKQLKYIGSSLRLGRLYQEIPNE